MTYLHEKGYMRLMISEFSDKSINLKQIILSNARVENLFWNKGL